MRQGAGTAAASGAAPAVPAIQKAKQQHTAQCGRRQGAGSSVKPGPPAPMMSRVTARCSVKADQWRLLRRRGRRRRDGRRGRQPRGRARARHRRRRGRQLLLRRRVQLLQAAAEHVKGFKGLGEDGLVAALQRARGPGARGRGITEPAVRSSPRLAAVPQPRTHAARQRSAALRPTLCCSAPAAAAAAAAAAAGGRAW